LRRYFLAGGSCTPSLVIPMMALVELQNGTNEGKRGSLASFHPLAHTYIQYIFFCHRQGAVIVVGSSLPVRPRQKSHLKLPSQRSALLHTNWPQSTVPSFLFPFYPPSSPPLRVFSLRSSIAKYRNKPQHLPRCGHLRLHITSVSPQCAIVGIVITIVIVYRRRYVPRDLHRHTPTTSTVSTHLKQLQLQNSYSNQSAALHSPPTYYEDGHCQIARYCRRSCL
jgi:hypothetical protein